MHVLFATYHDRLVAIHADIERALAGLPPEALDWTPGPGLNSLTVLAVHTAGAERYWIGDVAAQTPSDRDRDAEFQARGLGAAQLAEHLSETLAFATAALAQMRPEQLDELRTSPRDGRPYTVAWCLAHALEHTALHAGHMEITRQLWEQGRTTSGAPPR